MNRKRMNLPDMGKHSFKNVNGNIDAAYVVVVYGNVNGNIHDCENVYVINGKVNGKITDNELVIDTNG